MSVGRPRRLRDEGDGELDRLLSDLADDLLDEAGAGRLLDRLREDGGVRRRYLEFMALEAELGWEYGQAADEEGAGRPVRGRWGRAALILAPLAALVLLGLGLWGWTGRPVATLEYAEGAVAWTGPAGREALAGRREVGLAAGTLVVDGEGGAARLRLVGGMVVTVDGGTELAFSGRRLPMLDLRRGGISVERTGRGDAGEPARIRTPFAEVAVDGAGARVRVDRERTEVAVDGGRARLRRLSDGDVVDVGPGQRAVATLDVPAAMRVRSLAAAPETWRAELTGARPGLTRGRPVSSNPGVLEGEAYVAGWRPDGTMLMRWGVCFNGPPDAGGGLVRVTAGSVVGLRYRGGSGPEILLSLHGPGGRFGGNFRYDIALGESEPDAEGWRTVRVPVERFDVIDAFRGRGFRLDGNHVAKVLVSVSTAESFQLADLWIEPGRGGGVR